MVRFAKYAPVLVLCAALLAPAAAGRQEGRRLRGDVRTAGGRRDQRRVR
ncbi:hypothetical protein ACFQX7_06325 [Luedemannella flava]